MEPEKPLDVVNDFRIGPVISSGRTRVIYEGTHIKTKEKIAVKMENMDIKQPRLRQESRIYKVIRGGNGVADMKFYVIEGDYKILGMSLLGPSLETLFSHCNRRFSLKTVLMIAYFMIRSVEFIHAKYFVHGNIKPGHFCMGLGRHAKKVYAVDFGRAKPYVHVSTRSHIPYSNGKNLRGTLEYASLKSHFGFEISRRDDLESVGYVLLYFLRGSLPWQGLVGKNRAKMIKDMKLLTSIEALCEGYPSEFASYLHYCRSLKFDEKPDYSKMQRMFRELFLREGFKYDYVYDWNKKHDGGVAEVIVKKLHN